MKFECCSQNTGWDGYSWIHVHFCFDFLVTKKEGKFKQGKIMSAKVCQRFLYSLPTLENFFLTVGQNNFGNKIPLSHCFLGRLLFESTFVYECTLEVLGFNMRLNMENWGSVIWYISLLAVYFKSLESLEEKAEHKLESYITYTGRQNVWSGWLFMK